MSDPTSSLEVDVGDVTNDSSDEQDQFQPTQAKRRRNSSISHAPPLSPSTQLINVKLEVISDSGGESTSGSVHSRSPSPAPRERRHRECAEIAKTKFKPELVKREPGHENEHTVESREGSCERNDCPVQKTCCLAVSADCLHTRTDLGARIFHHINRVEHICSICYDLVYKVAPYSTMYNEWKGKWAMESQCVPTLKGYIQDQLLPFWLRCVDCGKYRSVDSTEVTIESKTAFVCTNGCKEDEDHVVNDAREHSWIFSIAASPLLHNSPARYYLRGNYYFDEVGMSPIANDDEEYEGCTTRSYLIPFHIPDENTPLIAFCVRPDVMEYDERISFSEYTMEPVFYLGLRNLILSLWALNPFEYLTLDTVLEHVLCRGVAHIWYNEEAKRVYDFLNTKCLINYGILNIPKNIAKPLTTAASGKKKPLEVLIIGAGVSGLSAARQLRSLGANVKVLEAKNVSGGRMQDDWSLGVAVGMGAQLVTGVTNNPLIVMCEQLGVGYRPTSRECPLMDVHTGLRLDIKVDLLVAEHFDCVLDILASWKLKNKGPDGSLIDHIMSIHKMLIKSGGIKWGDAEERAFQFHLGNIEFGCGAKLEDVSMRNWDQNEAVAMIAGAHALLTEGSSEIIKKLGEGTDVRHLHEVVKVDWRRRPVAYCKDGKKFAADKILLALPLAVLKKNSIEFDPPLPAKKRQSMERIGCGLIEKVAVRFPRRFWSHLLKKDGSLDFFSHVPRDRESRALFNMFYDFSTRGSPSKNQQFVLMSYVCADWVNVVNERSDVEVVKLFCQTLQEMFPNDIIPEPTGHVVTHWGRDPHIGMSYSYVRVGGRGEDYDNIAEHMDHKLYFAGECTNRFFPQTMTGAYMSGLREAGSIMESFKAEIVLD